MADKEKKTAPEQQQQQPGKEWKMHEKPVTEDKSYLGSGKLAGKVAIVTGGDSGIGKAISILFAKEGADIVIVYLDEHKDAQDAKSRVEANGTRCITIAGDVGDPAFCRNVVEKTIDSFSRLDILINNSAEQHAYDSVLDIKKEDLEKTFRTNIFSMFYLVQASLPHLTEQGGVIVNSTSITAYQGHPSLIPYACTKGAITVLTRSLAINLAEKGIRVNAVAPGPVWTPLIPASFSEEKVESFGEDTLMGRKGQPVEIAPSYLFLACSDSSYMTGQVLHPNGGRIVNA